jgi:putative transposase
MTRLAHIVIPGLPHHVTQWGNRRERVFFPDADYQFCLAELGMAAKKAGSEIWAWCLMPNHVHLVIAPADVDGLRLTVANAHRRYASLLNACNHWTGHVRQGRYGSVVMDEAHLMGTPDGVTTLAPALERVQDFAAFLGTHDAAAFEALRRAEITGRSIGGTGFLDALEARLGRVVKPQQRRRNPGRAEIR